MNNNQGWLCPKCHSAHAPDVKTCPSGQFGLPSILNNDCGCPHSSGACMNAPCPRRMYWTAGSYGSSGAPP